MSFLRIFRLTARGNRLKPNFVTTARIYIHCIEMGSHTELVSCRFTMPSPEKNPAGKRTRMPGELTAMDTTNPDDEVQRREREREKGRQEEQQAQREREMALEQGRKQGRDEERAKQADQKKKTSRGWGVRIILYLFIIVILIGIIGFLTLSVSVTSVLPGDSLPFTTTYAVTFPEGQSVTIGTSHITVLTYQNELISDIDGDRQKLVVGEDRVITERRAVITTFGVVTLMDTNFQINLQYKGDRDNLAYFDMAVHTSKQVPDLLIRQLLPQEIHATPV